MCAPFNHTTRLKVECVARHERGERAGGRVAVDHAFVRAQIEFEHSARWHALAVALDRLQQQPRRDAGRRPRMRFI